MAQSLDNDIGSRTIIVAILFGWFLLALDIRTLFLALSLVVVIAVRERLSPALAAAALAAPALPILVSHFGIEPFFSGKPITHATASRALESWIRLGGMALLSVAWLRSLNLTSAAQLCRMSGLGQYLLVPLLTASTFLRVTADRWLAIRELHALRQQGKLKKRTRIGIGEIPAIGLQLTMASLISSSELALACQGRGLGSRREIAVAAPRFSLTGVLSVVTLLLASAILVRSGWTTL